MNKREFLTLVKNLKEDVASNIEERRKELNEKIWALRENYNKEVKEALLDAIRKGELLRDIDPDKIQIITGRFKTEHGTIVAPSEFWLGNFKIPENVPEMPEELKRATVEYNKIMTLKFRVKRIIDAWKLRAIEHKTHNKEPFPEELCPYVSKEFRELINCGGKEE